MWTHCALHGLQRICPLHAPHLIQEALYLAEEGIAAMLALRYYMVHSYTAALKRELSSSYSFLAGIVFGVAFVFLVGILLLRKIPRDRGVSALIEDPDGAGHGSLSCRAFADAMSCRNVGAMESFGCFYDV